MLCGATMTDITYSFLVFYENAKSFNKKKTARSDPWRSKHRRKEKEKKTCTNSSKKKKENNETDHGLNKIAIRHT